MPRRRVGAGYRGRQPGPGRCCCGSSGPGCAARHRWGCAVLGVVGGTNSRLPLSPERVCGFLRQLGTKTPTPRARRAGAAAGTAWGCRAPTRGGTGARGRLAGTGRGARGRGSSRCQVLPSAPPATAWQIRAGSCDGCRQPCQRRRAMPASADVAASPGRRSSRAAPVFSPADLFPPLRGGGGAVFRAALTPPGSRQGGLRRFFFMTRTYPPSVGRA